MIQNKCRTLHDAAAVFIRECEGNHGNRLRTTSGGKSCLPSCPSEYIGFREQIAWVFCYCEKFAMATMPLLFWLRFMKNEIWLVLQREQGYKQEKSIDRQLSVVLQVKTRLILTETTFSFTFCANLTFYRNGHSRDLAWHFHKAGRLGTDRFWKEW